MNGSPGRTRNGFRHESSLGHFRSTERERAYALAYAGAMALLPPPQRTADVRTGFGSVRVYEFATTGGTDRTPVVLLPGRASGVPMWAANLTDLAAQRTVFALDALGDAGLSVQTRRIRDAADQAAWLEETFAGLDLDKTHVVGHSFGGWLAANHAVRYPDRIATLGLIEPVFVFQGLRARIYAESSVAALPFLPMSWRDRMLAHIGGVSEIDHGDPIARLISAATEGYAARLPAPRRISKAQLEGLAMPVWAALAQNSSIHDPRAAVAVARAHVADITVRLWPHTTHSLPMERPEQVDMELLDFMAAHEPTCRGSHR